MLSSLVSLDMTSKGIDRREHERFDASISVDYWSGETFLFSYIQNISEMGIFIASNDPLPVGTMLQLRFAPAGESPLEMEGEVVWVNPYKISGDNPNPGMGVRFTQLTPELRERVVGIVRTVAYLRSDTTQAD